MKASPYRSGSISLKPIPLLTLAQHRLEAALVVEHQASQAGTPETRARAQQATRQARAQVAQLTQTRDALQTALGAACQAVQEAQAVARQAAADGRTREDVARAEHAAQAAWRDLDQVRTDLRLIAGDVAFASCCYCKR